jgi:hypothetical protein
MRDVLPGRVGVMANRKIAHELPLRRIPRLLKGGSAQSL